MKRLLPIGSIVMIDLEKKEKIMILGRMIRKSEQDETIWDYCGCLAPYGIQSVDQFKVFNHEEISRLLFVGFQDEEEINYSLALSKVADENNK